MSTAEHRVHCPPHDRSEQSEPGLDFYGVAHDATTGIVEESSFVPPDTVPPSGRGLTEATPVREGDQINSVAVDWDDPEKQLPKDWGLCLPRLGVEGRTVSRIGHPDERRELPIDATYGRDSRPNL
jgi:hypothetical protein